MNFNIIEMLIACALFLLIGTIIGDLSGKAFARQEVQQDAVKAGVARWAPGPDGDPKFEWIVPKEKP